METKERKKKKKEKEKERKRKKKIKQNKEMASTTSVHQISNIYKSRQVLLELASTQQYDVSSYLGFSVNEVSVMESNDELDMLLTKQSSSPDDKPEKMFVKYYLGRVLKPNNLREIIEDLFSNEEVLTENDTLFIIVKQDINKTLINEIVHIWETEHKFVVIQTIERLQFNPLKHVLVPPHRVLSDGEKSKIMNKYYMRSDSEFPELRRFDPIAIAIFIKPGQVCEIMRPSKTAISAPYYRICI